MLSTTTKAVMMLAAFAIFFALVCPLAVTPITVQKHGMADLGIAPIAINAALVIAFYSAEIPLFDSLPDYDSASANDLNCVRNC